MTEEITVTKTPETDVERKVAAAQERNRTRSTARAVVEDHPIAVIAGGLLLGAVISRLLPRSGIGKLGSRAVTLAAAGAELAALYGSRAADSAGEVARDGREKLGELGETIGESASEARRRTVDMADVALTGAKALGSTAVRRAAEIVSKVRH